MDERQVGTAAGKTSGLSCVQVVLPDGGRR